MSPPPQPKRTEDLRQALLKTKAGHATALSAWVSAYADLLKTRQREKQESEREERKKKELKQWDGQVRKVQAEYDARVKEKVLVVRRK